MILMSFVAFCILATSGLLFLNAASSIVDGASKELIEEETGLSHKSNISQIYDGRRFAKLYREGEECYPLKWTTRRKPDGAVVVKADRWDAIFNSCKRHPMRNGAFKSSRMYPGTKWCGPGHRADNYTDLGWKVGLDKCCRTHDHCPVVIHAQQTRFGITNTRMYTRAHCECDDKLRQCLTNDNTSSARVVAKIYYNVLRMTCFREVLDRRNGTEQYKVQFFSNKRY